MKVLKDVYVKVLKDVHGGRPQVIGINDCKSHFIYRVVSSMFNTVAVKKVAMLGSPSRRIPVTPARHRSSTCA